MPKMGWTQREGKRFVFDLGFTCNIISLILLLTAFVSPYWVVSWPRVYSPFKKIGLWEVCFAGMVLEMDPAQKAYHGCWWIIAPEFMKIRSWLMPAWFVWTQVAVTCCLVAEILGWITMWCIWWRTGKTQRHARTKRRRDPLVAMTVCTGITLVTAIVMGITLIQFGIMFKFDRHWMPNPQLNYLSWSYGLAIMSCFFQIGGAIGQCTYLAIVRQEMREPPNADPMAPVTKTQYKGRFSQPDSREYIHRSKESVNKSTENVGRSNQNLAPSSDNPHRSNENLASLHQPPARSNENLAGMQPYVYASRPNENLSGWSDNWGGAKNTGKERVHSPDERVSMLEAGDSDV